MVVDFGIEDPGHFVGLPKRFLLIFLDTLNQSLGIVGSLSLDFVFWKLLAEYLLSFDVICLPILRRLAKQLNFLADFGAEYERASSKAVDQPQLILKSVGDLS